MTKDTMVETFLKNNPKFTPILILSHDFHRTFFKDFDDSDLMIGWDDGYTSVVLHPKYGTVTNTILFENLIPVIYRVYTMGGKNVYRGVISDDEINLLSAHDFENPDHLPPLTPYGKTLIKSLK